MRYRTAVPIGCGATGEVFEAWDEQLGREVALSAQARRSLAASRLFDAADTRRVFEEARPAALSALTVAPGHPDALAEHFRLKQVSERPGHAGLRHFQPDEGRQSQLADAARQGPDLARELAALLEPAS